MFFILNFIQSTRRNSVENIGYRATYITGTVAEVQSTEGKYKVKILDNENEYPNIWSIASNPDYATGETVGILWEYGIREKPVVCGVTRTVTYREVNASVNSLGV
ncbi:MAG: hypothetical protein V1709_06190 [Planctomycetota bacterium]